MKAVVTFLLASLMTSPASMPLATNALAQPGFTDASESGFSPDTTGVENAKALQAAVDRGGTVTVSRPGVYKIARTIFIGSGTSLVFGNGVFLEKVAESGPFTQVLLNKGALTRTYDHHITVDGLQLIVNGVDDASGPIVGLRGQIAFFYIKDLRISHFRCADLGRSQYCLQVCAFEDVVIDDVVIKGQKDGVHLGWGRRFAIRDGIFETGDDAIALNGHDYTTGNPELGWIEDGVVENCYDLPNPDQHAGYFCRILAGAWIDWKAGMEVQNSDTVVSNGRLYRVKARADGKIYRSLTAPKFKSGSQVFDGITWSMVQTNVTYTAGVRNVVFRNIFLEKPRTAFSIHFDNDKYSRSYYPGAKIPLQQGLVFDGIRVLYNQPTDFLLIGTPVDAITILNSSFRNNRIHFHGNKAMPDYLKTQVSMVGCVFNYPGAMELMANEVPNKVISLKTAGDIEVSGDFSARVSPGGGSITVQSDLTGLKP